MDAQVVLQGTGAKEGFATSCRFEHRTFEMFPALLELHSPPQARPCPIHLPHAPLPSGAPWTPLLCR
jgi:hypothetical protein